MVLRKMLMMLSVKEFKCDNLSARIIMALCVLAFAANAQSSPGSCDYNSMMNCMLSMGESTEKDRVFFPDTQEKLKKYCRHVMQGMKCAEALFEKCASEEEINIYKNLTVEMIGMNVALCTPGSNISSRFLKHVSCYKHLSSRFKLCSDRYIGNIVVLQGLSPDQQFKLACCTLHEYSRCMRNVVVGRCDKDAADLVEETVERTLNSPMHYCKQVNDIPTQDCRKKFTPISSQSSDDGSIDYDAENNMAVGARISYTCLSLVLVRLMLYR